MAEQLEKVISTDSKIENADDKDNQIIVETIDNDEKLEESEVKENENDNDIDTENETKTESKTTNSSAINIDFSSINYKDFEKINQEQIDLYYMLNDNKNNVEFLNEDLVALSKREEEIKALKEKEKEEFDFKMEELVSDGDEIKVDLTGIIDDLEIEKEK